MTSLFAFVFVLGVLIFVHELGHFLMARRIGVRVLTFSLGFGPKLIGFRRGDTEYCISAVPLGGYVKMAGETPEDTRTGASDEFLSKTKWQRFQVLVMGPVMNLALAVIVMALVLYQGAQVALLGEVIERDSTAAAQIAENTDKLAALQQAQADQFVATAATLDAQGEVIEAQAGEHRAAAEAQLADFVEQARQTLAPLAEHAQVSQGQIAAAVQQSTSSMEQSLASLREAVLNLNDVLGQLGGQQVVIQQTVAERRGWSLFRRNGKSHG